jgi:hypothetical protein
VRDDALVRRDADQPQRGCSDDGRGDLQRFVDLAGSSPCAGDAELDEHVHRTLGPARAQHPVHQLDGAQGVDPTAEAEARVGVLLGGDPAERGRVDQRVGQVQPPNAEGPADPQLRHVGQRDSPRARGELPGPERGRHRRLAVRREQDPGLGAVRGHRRQVRLEDARVEREQRRAEVRQPRAFGQELRHGPAPRGDRDRLEPPVQRLPRVGGQRLGVDRGIRGCHALCPSGALHMAQRILRSVSPNL